MEIALIDCIRARLANSVRRSLEDDGKAFGLIFRRKYQGVQTRAVAHSNHFFAFLERHRYDNCWLAADFVDLVFLAVFPPDETCDFALTIAQERCLAITGFKKEFGFSLRKDLESRSERTLHEEPVAFAEERENDIRVVRESILPNEFIKSVRIDFDFGGLRLLCARR